MRSFKSDNFSGVHPEIMDALQKINSDHAPSYGHDQFTVQADKLLEKIFGRSCKVAHVFNGTGANILCLRTALRPFQSVLCSEWSHIATNETGAAESIIGCKILTVPGRNGKIFPAEIERRYKQESLNEIHATQPKVLSIAQCTEYGTVYSVQELVELRSLCDDLKLYFHMDGCRLYNAAASLGTSLAEISSEVGADMLSLGGTKNGAMMAEAVVIFNEALWEGLEYLHKNTTQLASKNRYMASQFISLLDGDLWLRNASNANGMASVLSEEVSSHKQLSLAQPVETNHVFVNLPIEAAQKLQDKGWCYIWTEEPSQVRLVCSFDTTMEDISAFLADLESALA